MGGHGSLVHGRGTYWLRKVRAPGVSTRCSQGPLGDRGVEDDHPEVAEVASLSLGGWVICGVGVDRALVPGRRVADDWVEGHAHAGDAGGVEMGGPVRHGQKHGRRDQDAGAELRGPADRPPVDRADVGVPGAVGGTADDGASRGGEDGQGQRGKGDRPGDQSAGSCCPPFGGGGCESSWSSWSGSSLSRRCAGRRRGGRDRRQAYDNRGEHQHLARQPSAPTSWRAMPARSPATSISTSNGEQVTSSSERPTAR